MMKCVLVVLAVLGAATGTNAGGAIVVSDAWSRPAAKTAVVYAIVRNPASLTDRLIGGSSPMASRVELHESFEKKMPGMAMSPADSMDGMPNGDSMTTMKSLSSIRIAAHGTTVLEPGGYHLMLDLRRSLKPGETFALRLHFLRAGWVATTAYVRPVR